MKDDVVFTTKPRRQPSRPAQPERLREIFPAGPDGRSPVNWAQASPALRDAHNRLRKQRGLEPIPEPAIDLYQPLAPARKPFDFFVEPPQKGVRWPKGEKERMRPNPDLLRIVHGDHTLWQDLCDATESILAAIDGDDGKLRKRIYDDLATREEIRLLADLSGNKVQRPDHRPKQLRVALRRQLAKKFVAMATKAGYPRPKIVAAMKAYFEPEGLSQPYGIINEVKKEQANGGTEEARARAHAIIEQLAPFDGPDIDGPFKIVAEPKRRSRPSKKNNGPSK